MTKTILMIHGFGATGESWAPAAAKFTAAGYAVEHPTIHAAHRTVGPPPASLAGKTLAAYVAEMSDLARSIAARDGEKPVVFGHSMGGLIAQKLAEADLASGIVLFAPASPADARGKPKLSPMFTFLNVAATSKVETKAVKIWKTGFKWGVLNQTPASRHDAIFATTVHDSGRALADLAYPDRDPNKTAQVDAAKLTVPILILAGARDRATPIDDVRLVARKYAGSTFKEYPDNAHWLIDEPGSAEILGEVQTWLDAKGLGAKGLGAKGQPVKAQAATPAKSAVKTAPAKAPAAAKAKAAKAAAPPIAKAVVKASAKTATPKAAPTPKAAAKPGAATKAMPVERFGPGSKGPKPGPAEAPPKARAPAKTAAPAPEAITPEPKGPKTTAKAAPAPKAKAPAPAKTATPKVAKVAASKPAAPTAKPKAAAPKPKAEAAEAPAKAPAKTAAAPKTAPKTAKTAATKSTAKSSPSAKKSV